MELSEEQQKDVQEREKQFMEKYQALTEELSMDFQSFPMFIPNPNGTFSVAMTAQLRDKKYLPSVSPLSPM